MARKPARKRPDRTRPGRRAKGSAPASGEFPDFPSKEDIIAFVQSTSGKTGKREIARAFSIKAQDRKRLKLLLSEMSQEGLLAGNRREFRMRGGLPSVAVLEIVRRDDDGDLIAEPLSWDTEEGEKPTARVDDAKATGPEIRALGIGDRLLARLSPIEDPSPDDPNYIAEPIKRLPHEQRRLLGIFRHQSIGGIIQPIDKKSLREWKVRKGNDSDASDGDLVRFELERKGRFATPEARVVEVLGNPNDERQISLIAIHSHAIPDDFPETVIDAANALVPFDPDKHTGARTDLRDLPLLTIDPADARDHDDAVYAAPDNDPKNPGGHIVTVAIADVAYYVKPSSKLDREALLRGNSVYFPDRVVPMLPERISNDLCSLRELEDRPCIAIQMLFDKSGKKRQHTVIRGVMRSRAKLSYQQAQEAFDGRPDEKSAPLLEIALTPLWNAYQTLAAARDKRGPLELDLPERKIILDESGHVAAVHVPERLDAHRLIEEFMIQANVAAAEALEQKQAPVVYRVHDKPSKEKLKSLRDFLETLDISLPSGDGLQSAHFNAILSASKDLPVKDLVHEVILRTQSQAVYTSENLGHFGLNLSRYAHFTSPIRRYADLLVHRCLITLLGIGDDGIDPTELQDLEATAERISNAERRAMAAERETVDRLIAVHLADRIGAEFAGRISGLTRSGLFVRLQETGADGYIPAATLADDYYVHDEEVHALIGERTGRAYRLGDTVTVKILEVIPSAGAIRFEMLTPPSRGVTRTRPGRTKSSRGPRRGPPKRGRRR